MLAFSNGKSLSLFRRRVLVLSLMSITLIRTSATINQSTRSNIPAFNITAVIASNIVPSMFFTSVPLCGDNARKYQIHDFVWSPSKREKEGCKERISRIAVRRRPFITLCASFLGAFRKSQKATIGVVMFVCPSVSTSACNNSASTGRILLKFYISATFPLIFLELHRPDTAQTWAENLYTTWQLRGTLKMFLLYAQYEYLQWKLKNSSCAATIYYAREHLSYCAAAHPRNLDGTLHLTILWKSIEKIVDSLNSDKNNGHFTWRPTYIYDNTSLNSS
jgi:hypothetical protein